MLIRQRENREIRTAVPEFYEIPSSGMRRYRSVLYRSWMYLGFFFLFSEAADAQTFKWAQKIGGTYIGNFYGVTTDKNNNFYLYGNYRGNVSHGAINYTSTSGPYHAINNLLLKFGAGVSPGWSKSSSGEFNDNITSAETDKDGNLYVLGNVSIIGSTGGYLAKYTSAGNQLWLKPIPEGIHNMFNRLKLDISGNVFVSRDATSFGQRSAEGGYIVKYNSNGEELLALKIPAYEDFALDQTGNIYITGPTDKLGSYVRKYAPAGQLVWETIISSSFYAFSKHLVADADGNTYLSGDYCGKISFGNSQVEKICSASGTNNIFIARVDQTGKQNWIISAGGELHNRDGQLAINKKHLYFAGIFAEKGQVAGTPTVNGLGVLKVNLAGNIEWFKPVPGKYLLSHPVSLTPYQSGLLVAGSFYADTAEDFMNFDGVLIAREPGRMTLFAAYLEESAGTMAMAEPEQDNQSRNVARLLIPNIITPNADDKNEAFTMPELTAENQLGDFKKITIYNRWGTTVFETKSSDFRWNAAGLASGVYFYNLSFANYTYRGNITVVK